ncbi:hypothetical protein RTBOTA2_003121, partial [Rhodotorula toruloides]
RQEGLGGTHTSCLRFFFGLPSLSSATLSACAPLFAPFFAAPPAPPLVLAPLCSACAGSCLAPDARSPAGWGEMDPSWLSVYDMGSASGWAATAPDACWCEWWCEMEWLRCWKARSRVLLVSAGVWCRRSSMRWQHTRSLSVARVYWILATHSHTRWLARRPRTPCRGSQFRATPSPPVDQLMRHFRERGEEAQREEGACVCSVQQQRLAVAELSKPARARARGFTARQQSRTRAVVGWATPDNRGHFLSGGTLASPTERNESNARPGAPGTEGDEVPAALAMRPWLLADRKVLLLRPDSRLASATSIGCDGFVEERFRAAKRASERRRQGSATCLLPSSETKFWETPDGGRLCAALVVPGFFPFDRLGAVFAVKDEEERRRKG